MTFSKILGELRSHLISNTAPTAELAQRAGQMAVDADQHLMLSRITTGRELAGAVLWQRIADHLTGQTQAEALVFGAICAFNSGRPHMVVAFIERHRACVDKGDLTGSALIEILKLDYRVAGMLDTQSTTQPN